MTPLCVLLASTIYFIAMVFVSILALILKGWEKPWYKINRPNWALVPILGILLFLFIIS